MGEIGVKVGSLISNKRKYKVLAEFAEIQKIERRINPKLQN